MPLYRYRCNQCGHEFSERQRFSDEPLTECPVCTGEVRRVINSVGIVFKGSGFYVTDNRNGSSSTTLPATDAGKNEKKASGGKSKPTDAAATAGVSAAAD